MEPQCAKLEKVGSGLPIFAFDGPMARTPLGSIQVNKLLEGNSSTDDFTRLVYVRESYEEAYDIDSVADPTYTFSSPGVAVKRDSLLLYTIDPHRELPDLVPSNYDVALIGARCTSRPLRACTLLPMQASPMFPTPLPSKHILTVLLRQICQGR